MITAMETGQIKSETRSDGRIAVWRALIGGHQRGVLPRASRGRASTELQARRANRTEVHDLRLRGQSSRTSSRTSRKLISQTLGNRTVVWFLQRYELREL